MPNHSSAPEVFHGVTEMFYAPVDDFELAVTRLTEDGAAHHPLPGRGPRILLCLDGHAEVRCETGSLVLSPGDAMFGRADEGPLRGRGSATLVRADVP